MHYTATWLISLLAFFHTSIYAATIGREVVLSSTADQKLAHMLFIWAQWKRDKNHAKHEEDFDNLVNYKNILGDAVIFGVTKSPTPKADLTGDRAEPAGFDCPANGLFPNADDKQSFFNCWEGVAVLQYCVKEFLPEINNCKDREFYLEGK